MVREFRGKFSETLTDRALEVGIRPHVGSTPSILLTIGPFGFNVWDVDVALKMVPAEGLE